MAIPPRMVILPKRPKGKPPLFARDTCETFCLAVGVPVGRPVGRVAGPRELEKSSVTNSKSTADQKFEKCPAGIQLSPTDAKPAASKRRTEPTEEVPWPRPPPKPNIVAHAPPPHSPRSPGRPGSIR